LCCAVLCCAKHALCCACTKAAAGVTHRPSIKFTVCGAVPTNGAGGWHEMVVSADEHVRPCAVLLLPAATMLSQRIPGFVNDKDKTFPRQLFAFCVDGIASEWPAGNGGEVVTSDTFTAERYSTHWMNWVDTPILESRTADCMQSHKCLHRRQVPAKELCCHRSARAAVCSLQSAVFAY
jgi:hypothetical protein